MIEQKGAVPIWILAGILILIILGILIMAFGLPFQTENPKSTPLTQLFPTPAASIQNNVQDLYFYRLEVKRKSNSPTPAAPLGLYLAKVLGLPKAYQQSFNLGLGLLMYDSRETDPYKDRYNADYYLVVQNAKSYGVETSFDLNPDQTYQDQSITIKVATPSADLLPFMTTSSNYCQTDSDCSYIYKYCKSTATNYYAWASDQGGCEVANQETHIQTKCQVNQCVEK